MLGKIDLNTLKKLLSNERVVTSLLFEHRNNYQFNRDTVIRLKLAFIYFFVESHLFLKKNHF